MTEESAASEPWKRLSRRLCRCLSWVADRVHHNRFLFLLCFSVLFFVSTALRAGSKPFWNDELYTLYIARIPSLSALWTGLLDGLDATPPLNIFATRAAHALFGEGHVTTRLPAMIGLWLMCLCIYRFVYRRSNAVYASVALLLPLVTEAYPYAYEARSYGLMLGLCGVSLVCWQSAAEGARRWLSLAGLGLSLAAALCNHYYAALVLVSLGIGELVRVLQRRRIDVAMWIALALPLIVFLPLSPLIQGARTFARAATKPDLTAINYVYSELFLPAVPEMTAILIVLAVVPFLRRVDDHPEPTYSLGLRFYEVAAALALMLIPVMAVVGTILTEGFLHARYTLPAVVGFSIVLTFVVLRSEQGRAIAGSAVLILLSAAFLKNVAGSLTLRPQPSDIRTSHPLLQQIPEQPLPLVIADGRLFLQLQHYAPESLASRVHYLNDLEAAANFGRGDAIERSLAALRQRMPISVPEYKDFLAAHKRFFVYESGFPWLVSRLLEDGFHLQLQGRDGAQTLLLADGSEGSVSE